MLMPAGSSGDAHMQALDRGIRAVEEVNAHSHYVGVPGERLAAEDVAHR